jgi:hypothetical protein
MGVTMGWSVGIVLIYGLATGAFPYAGAFYSHQLTAFLLFGAFYIAYFIHARGISPRWSLVAGFMLSYSIISEYPTVLIAAAVFLYLCLALPQKRWIVWVIVAGIPPGLLLMAYNLAIFHTPLPVGYEYSALFAELHSQGLISLTYPHAEALWGITFGSFRGLFYVSPVLLIGIIGFWPWWRSGKFRAEWVVCVWSVVSFFLFNGSSVMWQGGFSIGPRYLIPMLPFLVIGIGAFARRWGDELWARVLTIVLAAWSLVVVWAQTLGGQNYPDWTPEPLFNYSLPRLIANDFARNLGMALNLRGWASLFPLALVLVVLVFILAIHVRRQRQQSSAPASTAR